MSLSIKTIAQKHTKQVSVIVLVSIASLLIILCSLGIFTDHSADFAVTAKAKVNCSAACDSHGQATTNTFQTIKKDDDDKEPTPPLNSWIKAPVNLLLLYVVPITAAIIYDLRNKHLFLTMNLRF